MQLRNEHHSFTGMQRDLSVSKHPASFLYNANNIRLTPRNGDTMYAITNEKGTLDTEITLEGTYLGHCLLNQYLVVFTHVSNSKDCIYRIDLDTNTCVCLYNTSSLGFSIEHPIKAISSFENSNIQKIYWTDGKNQPRVINILDDYSKYNSNSFEFVPKLKLNEHVKVTKLVGSGEFPPGVIQYAFTYFNRYKQESNIFYVTPLQYISYIGRAGSPEEKIANAFRISLSNLDTENFEFLRIYSILRTSINGTPVVKRVQDMKLLDDRTISEEVNTSSNWMYQFISNTSKIKVSVDSGLTFSDDLTKYEVNPKDAVPFDSDEDGISSRDSAIEWNGSVVSGKNGTAYKFDKSKYPELVIKLDDFYYTWGDSIYGDTVTIYIGVSDTYGGYKVFVGENSPKGASNIIKTDKIQVGEDIIVGVTFVDDGTQGEYIDPTELLYKGGEIIKANTIAQKDGTLFLGGISLTRDHPNIKDALLKYTGVLSSSGTLQTCLANDKVTSVLRNRPYVLASKQPFSHIDTLSGPVEEDYLGASFFKSKEYYRLGVQFQHESGKWSEPYWIGDKQGTVTPMFDEGGNNANYITKGIGVIATPEYSFSLSDTTILTTLDTAGYKRARAVFAVPSNKDRTILCQGVICPSLYRKVDRHSNAKKSSSSDWNWEGSDNLGTIYAQASWVFRPYTTTYQTSTGGGGVQSQGRLWSHFDDEITSSMEGTVSSNLASTEVMGIYDDGHCFYADRQFVTFHSPDVLFDDSFAHMDFAGCHLSNIGTVKLGNTYGDISIQTSSPPIGSSAGGFVHKAIKTNGESALITGLFYNDYLVDDADSTPKYNSWRDTDHPPVDWPVFLWHRTGSLNNDVNRSGRSAELLKKKISNYRQGDSTTYFSEAKDFLTHGIGLFNSDQLTMIKVNGHPYRGNIETMVTPTTPSPFYIVGNPLRDKVDTTFTSHPYYKLAMKNPLDESSGGGLWNYNSTTSKWEQTKEEDGYVGDYVKGLRQWKEGVSIKYKSTPHLAIDLYSDNDWISSAGKGCLALAEVRRAYDENTMFGGFTEDALEAATWIPCGPVVSLNTSKVVIEFKWGDTYMQRFECLKTYPFTQEDKNQVVDIASFMCETRVNIDGRYDRNRGQASNLNMSPTNFNLLNPVYSQLDNFFSYRILDDSYYEITEFPNQITWSKEKQPGSDIDLYTNITLASTYNMDGSKGGITSLNSWKDMIYCFQDRGVSNILFNSRVQIPTSDNVPIEITNSYKVDGHRYLAEGMGCASSSLVQDTPSGIYFIDSVSNRLFNIGNSITDVTTTHNMTSWFRNHGASIKRVVYDGINSDIYLIKDDTALCFSEVLGQFTSFMNYEGISLMESYSNHVFSLKGTALHKMFEGNYNEFFGQKKPWDFTFISNGSGEGVMDFDKIFSTIDYRMDMSSVETGFQHNMSLDFIRVENEYQDTTELPVTRAKIMDKPFHHGSASLQKKFRTWRIQVPRNYNSLDRIRSPWCKITLGSKGENTLQSVLHDLNVQYYM